MKTKFYNFILLALLLIISSVKTANAQCGTVMVGPNRILFPAEDSLPAAQQYRSYYSIIQLYAPSAIPNLNTYNVTSITFQSVTGLPSSFTYTTSPASGTVNVNSSGCLIISSNRVDAPIGNYPIVINVTVNDLVQGAVPAVIQGYQINIEHRTNGTQKSGNYNNTNVFATKIGTTLNNQQTNGAAYRRIAVLPNNRIGATWTTSSDASPFSNRGTGYNQFNGTNWVKGDTTSSRIENQRAGFPSYAFNSNTNEELVLSHIVTSSGYSGGFVLSRKSPTANSWNISLQLDTIATVPGLLWCRTAIANNFLHVIAAYTDSTANQPNRVTRRGVRSPIVYSRFNLNTNNWDIKTIVLPGYDSTRYYSGEGDSYAIDANGNQVGVLIGGTGKDLSLWKSNNSGTSWTKIIIDTFYQSPFNEATTLIDPAVNNVSKDLHLLLDQSGNSHCFWTNINFINSDLTDGTWNYYPSNSHKELMYWREGTPILSKKSIYTSTSNNNWQDYSGQSYGNSFFISNPTAGISSNGRIFCAFSNTEESSGHRDVYIISTNDNGQTWSNAKNITSTFGQGIEQAFPSLARTVNNKLHLVYSQSTSVGPNTAGAWDIMYQGFDTSFLEKPLYLNTISSYNISDTILCKGQYWTYSITNAKLYLNDTLYDDGQIGGGTIQMMKSTNIKIRSLDSTLFLNVQIKVDTINIPNKNVTVPKLGLCLNDTITMNAVAAGNYYKWFKDEQQFATTRSIRVSEPGNYFLYISDSIGCANLSNNFKIFNAPLPQALAWVNDTNQCLKNNVFIFRDSTKVDSGSYSVLWNFGAGNTSTVKNVIRNYTSVGTFNYKLSVTTNYGCKDSVIGTVSTKASPVAGILIGDSAALSTSVTYTYAVSQQLNHTYNWFVTNGIVLSGQGSNNVSVRWTSNGAGKISCVITNNLLCQDTVSMFVSVGTSAGIVSFNPTSAGTGQMVSIFGANLNGATAVKFGGVNAQSYTVVSANRIDAILGSGASGEVRVETPNGIATALGFTHLGNIPTLNSFNPSSAVTGQTVTILGSYLNTATAVKFGGVNAQSFTIISASRIDAIVGSGATGDVSVEMPSGTLSLTGFTHLGNTPVILSFSPTSAAAGQTVILSGVNLQGATSVKFGNVSAQSYNVISSTQISAIVGSGATGEVSVETPNGKATKTGFIHLGNAPAITSFNPTSAKTGQTVTIIGVNFTGATEVKFGGVAAQSFSVVNSTQITAVVENGASGEISVITPNGNALLAGFTYLPNTGLVEKENTNGITIYPNPASSVLNIQFDKPGNYTAKLTNTLGKTQSFATSGTIDISTLADGVYLINIYDNDDKLISVNKIIIAK